MSKTKWTKGGLKIEKSEYGTSIERHGVVSITTVSLKEILKLFRGNRILKLKARGSNRNELDEDNGTGLGFNIKKMNSTMLMLDYNAEKHIPLDNFAENKILNILDQNYIEDMPIQEITVCITDKELGEIAQDVGCLGVSKKDTEFYATFIAEHCDGEGDKQRIIEHPTNKNLIENYHFKYMILNLKNLINKMQILTLPKRKHKQIISCGKTYYSLYSPFLVTQRLKMHLGEYGLMKYYQPGKEDKLMLVNTERWANGNVQIWWTKN